MSVSFDDILAVDPNWIQPVSLRLRFITEIDGSAASQEQRTALRPAVSLGLSALYDTIGREQHARKIISQLRNCIGKRLLVPLWTEAMKLANAANATATVTVEDATNRIANRKYGLLWKDYLTFEQVAVTTVTGNAITLSAACSGSFAAGTYFVPCFVTNVITSAEMGADWQTANLLGTTASWEEEPLNILATGLSAQDAAVKTIESVPLFPILAEWNTAPKESLNRPLATVNISTGLSRSYPLNNDAISAFNFALYLQDRDEIGAFVRFFERIMGRKSRFWFSFGKADFVPLNTATASTQIVAQDTGFYEAEWLAGINATPKVYSRAFVLILDWANLVWQARRIVSVAKTNGHDVLTLNATVPRMAPDVLVSQLMLVRSTLDEVSLAFNHSAEAAVSMNVQELTFDYDEFAALVNTDGTLANTRRLKSDLLIAVISGTGLSQDGTWHLLKSGTSNGHPMWSGFADLNPDDPLMPGSQVSISWDATDNNWRFSWSTWWTRTLGTAVLPQGLSGTIYNTGNLSLPVGAVALS